MKHLRADLTGIALASQTADPKLTLVAVYGEHRRG